MLKLVLSGFAGPAAGLNPLAATVNVAPTQLAGADTENVSVLPKTVLPAAS